MSISQRLDSVNHTEGPIGHDMTPSLSSGCIDPRNEAVRIVVSVPRHPTENAVGANRLRRKCPIVRVGTPNRA